MYVISLSIESPETLNKNLFEMVVPALGSHAYLHKKWKLREGAGESWLISSRTLILRTLAIFCEDVVMEYIKQPELKYLRALGCAYLRITARPGRGMK